MKIRNTNEEFEINGHIVKPGESKIIEIQAGELYTHTPITIPVRVISGKNKGPRLFVSGVIHGDEINGVEIIRRLLSHKSLLNLRGTLIAVPVVNVHGFLSHSRYLPDRRDLNRSFPGNEHGSLASRLARLFSEEIVDKCTHGIDLHTASGHRFNLPQIRAYLNNDEITKLANTFGAPVILNSNIKDGSLRESVVESGKPFLLYEAGEVLRFDEFSIRLGVAGILSVMRTLGMLKGKPYKSRFKTFIANSSTWVRAPRSGILKVDCQLGGHIAKGDRLGRISGPMGEGEISVKSSVEGIIISNIRLPLVNEGDALFHIARFKGSKGDPDDLSFVEDLNPDEVYPQLR